MRGGGEAGVPFERRAGRRPGVGDEERCLGRARGGSRGREGTRLAYQTRFRTVTSTIAGVWLPLNPSLLPKPLLRRKSSGRNLASRALRLAGWLLVPLPSSKEELGQARLLIISPSVDRRPTAGDRSLRHRLGPPLAPLRPLGLLRHPTLDHLSTSTSSVLKASHPLPPTTLQPFNPPRQT